MPIDKIKIDQASPGTAVLARDVLSAKRFARQAYDAIIAVKSQMDHLTDGTDFATLATICGVASADAQTLYNLFAGAVAGMTGAQTTADYKNLTERVM